MNNTMSSVQPTALLSKSDLNGATESSALLSINNNASSSQHEHGADLPATITSTKDYEENKPTLILALCIACILFIDSGLYLQMAPLTRILESIVCDSYYSQIPELRRSRSAVPEDMCKIPVVQSPVALLKGWFALVDCIPGLLLSVPYGIMADKYGRKVVMVLSIVGIAIATGWVMLVCYFPNVFPVQLIWLAPAFNLIGGGGIVASSTILTMIADVFPERQRSIIFFRVSGAVLAAQLIAIPISSMMMEHSLWAPMFLGEGAVIIAGLICVFMPETLKAQLNADALLSSSVDGDGVTEGVEGEEEESHDLRKVNLSKRLVEATNGFLKESKAIFASPGTTTVVVTFLVNSIGRSSIDLLLQYVSQRYHWTIAQASRLLSLRVFTQLLLYFVILPVTSLMLTKYSYTNTTKKDLQISRMSAILLAIGYLGIGLAATPVQLVLFIIINGLGTGYSVAIRVLATSLVEPSQVGRLYAAIATVDGIGGLLAGPALSGLYSWGLGQDGFWSGAPFLLAGLLYAGITISVWILRVRE